MKSQFLLNPEITYLNHGSFGACPKPVFEAYQKWQLELEKEPVQFVAFRGADLLKDVRKKLADFVHCHYNDLVLVPNPSTAMNTVIKSLDLNPSDEILATNQEYGAMDRTWNFICKKTGAKYVRQTISLPLTTKEKFIEEFWKGYSSKTKVIFINEITSSTGLIFPVKEICDEAKKRGLLTIVDGAHVPAHIDLNLEELDADIYTGTCHKWILAPKGSSFLYVRRELQEMIDPLVVSWGYESLAPSDSQFIDHHEYQGTRDISAFLATGDALDYIQANNWKEHSTRCKQLIRDNYELVCNVLGTTPICPVTEEFLGQLCSCPIKTNEPAELQKLLYQKYKIEIPIMELNGVHYIRISIQVYNDQSDIDHLIKSLQDIINTTDLIKV